jgi:pimeloyl-ACP methyl ester carboxylesterase
VIALLLAALLAAPASAQVPTGPASDAFYTPPPTLPAGHGTPIWQRKLSGPVALKSAKRNRLVLYRSTATNGAAIAVSGTVAVPKGKAPKRGWPVISWAHGTTGIADACAPSRSNALGGYDHTLLNRWLKAGYAVVRTDYEGLGTPGDHPYLIGVSEGRSALDIVRAARKLDRRIGKRVLLAGHSQGGHAALWAASLQRKWAPELKLRGTLAFAPASHIGDQAALLRVLDQPSGLSGLAALILRGIDIARPDLNLQAGLSERAAALYPEIGTKCLGDLSAPTSFGGVAPAALIRPEVPVDPVVAALNANDPETLTIRGPVRIAQGTADTTVFPNFTQALVNEIKADVSYKTYSGVDHGGVVARKAPANDAAKFVSERLG